MGRAKHEEQLPRSNAPNNSGADVTLWQSMARLLALLLCTLAVVSAPGAAFAQAGPKRPFTPSWKVAIPPAPHLFAVAFSIDGSHGVAVGQRGTVMVTDDQGASWRLITPADANEDLQAVAYADASTAVAVGDKGRILFTADAGETWHALATKVGVTNDLRSLVFPDSQHGIAVGDGGIVIISSDSGKSWQTVSARPLGDNDLVSVSAVAGAAVVSGAKGQIAWSDDGGKSWNPSVRPTGTEFSISSVMLISATAGVAAVDWTAAGDISKADVRRAGLLISADMGRSWAWAQGPEGTLFFPTALAFGDESHGVAVGTSAPAAGRHGDIFDRATPAIMFTLDGGKSWQLADAASTFSMRAVAFSDGGNATAVGQAGTMLATSDFGRTWKAIGGAGTEGLLAIAFIHAKGAAVGETIETTDDTNGAAESVDQWRHALLPDGFAGDITQLFCFGDQSALALSESSVRLTIDGGASWSRGPAGGLGDVVALDSKNLIALDSGGRIVSTTDGGLTWHPIQSQPPEVSFLTDVALLGSKGLVAFGQKTTFPGPTEHLAFWSEDHGTTWHPSKFLGAADLSIHSIVVKSGDTVFATTFSPTILSSFDGGRSWTASQLPTGARVDTLEFLTGSTWLALTSDGIFESNDDGTNWTKTSETYAAGLVRFDDMRWLAWSTGSAVRTDDAGKTWVAVQGFPSNVISSTIIPIGYATAVTLTDHGGVYLSRNFGADWLPSLTSNDAVIAPYLDSKTKNDLYQMHLTSSCATGDGQHVMIAGQGGIVLAESARKLAAYIANAETAVQRAVDGSFDLDLDIVGDPGTDTKIGRIEYNVVTEGRTAYWKDIPMPPAKSVTTGKWHARWDPGVEHISGSSTIQHRVWLTDGGPPTDPIPLNDAEYQPFWVALMAQYGVAIGALGALVGLAILYLLPVGLLFLFRPTALAGGGGVMDALKDGSVEGNALVKILAAVLRAVTLPWFKRHSRVRGAWIQAYVRKSVKFADLAPDVRADFLSHDDVLDAWVSERASLAREGLEKVSLYGTRKTYIRIPLVIGDSESGRVIDQPGPSEFRNLFASQRVVCAIIGAGGAGKSTLACALARWSLALDETDRLQPFLAIPVIVDEETVNLLEAATGALRRMLGARGELDVDIVAALLLRKRVVVVVDALSERSQEMQAAVDNLFSSDTPIQALIVTARREPRLEGVDRVVLAPQQITLILLVPFILEYLRRRQLVERFNPEEQLALAQRILQIVRTGGGLSVTPLLVILFVDAATETSRSGGVTDLPIDVPEVYLDYLDRLNAVLPGASASQGTMALREAALGLANASLGQNCVPTDFRRSDAEHVLTDLKLPSEAIDRLISNGIVTEREVAGVQILRFQLDPVAEYLAAISTCRRLGSDGSKWTKEVGRITELRGYPISIQGYLSALSVCYAAYKQPLSLADVELPWTT